MSHDWRWFNKVRLRLRSIFRRSEMERELDEELRYHLNQVFPSRSAT